MSFLVSMGNSEPATTEAVFGITNEYKSFNLNLDQATPEQQQICATFFGFIGGHASINIINSAHSFIDCTYIVVSGVDEQFVEIDYAKLSNTNKGKINGFANLLKSIAQ